MYVLAYIGNYDESVFFYQITLEMAFASIVGVVTVLVSRLIRLIMQPLPASDIQQVRGEPILDLRFEKEERATQSNLGAQTEVVCPICRIGFTS